MKDNNTYTGDGDDLDLVTLEKIKRDRKRERDRERQRERERQGGDLKKKTEKEAGKQKKKTVKNRCEEEIDNINILIKKCTGRKKRERDREKGRIVHTVIQLAQKQTELP